MTTVEERTVNGYRVVIGFSRTMHFPVSQGTTHTEVKPGVSISVHRPDPDHRPQEGDEPHRRHLYGGGYEGKFDWPGKDVFHPDRKNTMGSLGAYVFEPASDEDVEAFLAPRIARAIQIARKRDTPEILALQQIRQYEGPQWLVDLIGPLFTPSDEAWYHFEEWQLWTQATREILDTNIRGWGSHNAILRYQGDLLGDRRDYLATVRYLTPAYVAEPQGVEA